MSSSCRLMHTKKKLSHDTKQTNMLGTKMVTIVIHSSKHSWDHSKLIKSWWTVSFKHRYLQSMLIKNHQLAVKQLITINCSVVKIANSYQQNLTLVVKLANRHQQRLWCGPYLILCVVTWLVDSGEDQPSLCPPQQCIKPSVGGFGFLEGQRPIWGGQKGQKARRPPAIHDAPFHNFLRTKLPHIIISRRAAMWVWGVASMPQTLDSVVGQKIVQTL